MDKPLPSERPTGIGVAAFNLAKALAGLGLDTHLVCRGTENPTFPEAGNLTVHAIRNYSRDNLRTSLEVLKHHSFDIAHVHSPPSTMPSLLLTKALRRPLVVHSHGVELVTKMSLFLRRFAGMRLANSVIAPSKEDRDRIMRCYSISPDNIVVVNHGVDTESFKPGPPSRAVLEKFGLTYGEKIMISVGLLQSRKGQWRILECLPQLLKRHPKLQYVNIGGYYDKEYANRIQARVNGLGLNKAVRFLGQIPEIELVSLMNSADVCVHASSDEGFGLAVIEEMACGKAVIAFNTSTMPEIIENSVDGILVSPFGADGLSKAILGTLNDTKMAQEIGRAARAKVLRKFTWNRAARIVKELYESFSLSRRPG